MSDTRQIKHKHIIDRVAERSGVPKEVVRRVIGHTFRVIRLYIEEAEPYVEIRLLHLGRIKVKAKPGFEGRSPVFASSGGRFVIPTRRRLVLDPFSPIKRLMRKPVSVMGYNPPEEAIDHMPEYPPGGRLRPEDTPKLVGAWARWAEADDTS